MLDQGTRETLHEAIGKQTLGEQMLQLVECTLETRHSLGNEGLLAVTATRVLFATRDSLHGTQVSSWDRRAISDVVLKTDLFGAKLTLRTADRSEFLAHRFADDGDGAALVAILDDALDDVPLTMEPQPAVFEVLGTEPPPGPPDPTVRPRSTSILVLAGMSLLIMLCGASSVMYLLMPSPKQAPVVAPEVVEIVPSEPSGSTTIPPLSMDPSPEGYGLAPETIDRVMQRNSLDRCFREAVDRGAPFQGQLGLTFLINPTGDIAAVSIDDMPGVDDTLAQCLATRMARLRFPAFEGGDPQTVFWQLQVE